MEWFTPEVLTIIWAVVKALIILFGSVIIAALLIMVERRLLALWQDRYGPNRVGPFGVLQIVADMLKMFFKEDWTPPFADKLTFWLAPFITMITMMLMMALVPIAPDWMASDLDVGMLIFLALAGLAVYSVIFAGWSSNSKYAFLGGLRSTAQTLSYEVFMGLSLMGVVVITGSFKLTDIVKAQESCWFFIPQFFGFITFSIAAIAVTHRFPFDFPEAEQELAAGYQTEYSGLKWGMFYVAEYVAMVVVASLIVTFFLGGWNGPILPPFIWFAGKTFFVICMFILIRGSLMRPRYDQVMNAGWKFCLPLTLLNLVITAAVVLAQSNG